MFHSKKKTEAVNFVIYEMKYIFGISTHPFMWLIINDQHLSAIQKPHSL